MASRGQEQKILRLIQLVSLILTVIFAIGGYVLRSPTFALSVLFGSVLVNGSFWILKRDAEQVLNRVASSAAEASRAVQRMERVRFVVKFYAKLIVLGLLLYAASTRMQLDMIGVALGLSTVMLSVIGIVLGGGRKLYSVQSV